MGVYEEFEVTPIINAVGYVTRLGGSLMLPEVVAAMQEAAGQFVSMAELQDAASHVIARYTGAAAGYVTSGSAAALTLAAAACIAGTDCEAINRLPDTGELPNQIVIPWPHRDSYDRCFRVAGAHIVTAGTAEGCTAEQVDAAIGPRAVAVGWFSMYEPQLALPPVVEVAHARGLPVIVDAAIALPPADNLGRFVREGADLVAFSAGKDMRGPQTAGFLAGRADLLAALPLLHQDMAAYTGRWEVGSAYGSPGHGLGRPMKVGKEELAGALVALRLYFERDHAAELAAQEAAMRLIADRLAGVPGVTLQTGHAQTPGHYVRLTVDPAVLGIDARDVAARVEQGRPRVVIGAPFVAGSQTCTIGTATLGPGEAEVVAERVRAVLRDAG